ncbi:hypothetical protein AMECASPLE_029993 [Ameca splendens]|uniref:Uncharacterized protein n=1 Tax=Ameca splendens TaxID=208324 RepID=A0ABV0XIV7_9TELE
MDSLKAGGAVRARSKTDEDTNAKTAQGFPVLISGLYWSLLGSQSSSNIPPKKKFLVNLLHGWQPQGSSFLPPLCNLFALQRSGQDPWTSPAPPLSFSTTHTCTKPPNSAYSPDVIIHSYQ